MRPSSVRSAHEPEMPSVSRRAGNLLPYALLAPGLLWLLDLLRGAAVLHGGDVRSKTGHDGDRLPVHLAFPDVHRRDLELPGPVRAVVRVRRAVHADRAPRSRIPLAYVIAFRGGK